MDPFYQQYLVYMQLSAIIVGWVLVCVGIVGFFIPDPKIDTVNGESEFLKEKQREALENANKPGKFAFLFKRR